MALTRIQALAFIGAVGGIKNAALADLEQEFSIMGVLLDDAVAVAGDPDIVVAVGVTTVNDAGQLVPIAIPGAGQVAGKIKQEYRWRLL